MVVSDSSTIIELQRINHLDLLSKLFSKIHIPNAVLQEILNADKEKQVEIQSLAWLKVVEISDTALSKAIQQKYGALHLGEIEAIVLAYENKADLLAIDERIGRKVATEYNIKLIGVLGILLQAKTNGYIDLVTPLMTALKEKANFRISDRLFNIVKKAAGE